MQNTCFIRYEKHLISNKKAHITAGLNNFKFQGVGILQQDIWGGWFIWIWLVFRRNWIKKKTEAD